MTTIKLGWGQEPSGKMVHIKSASRGMSCKCVCPDCGTALIAKQGQEVSWHFAHASPVNCTGESALHKAAKQILIDAASKGECLLLPGDSGFVHAKDALGIEASCKWELNPLSFLASTGQLEAALRGDLIVDVLLHGTNGEPALAVEIYVTNKKTYEDISKFHQLTQDSIEIDLSNIQWDSDTSDIKAAVLTSAPRHWLYSLRSQSLTDQAKKKLELIVNSRNDSYQIDIDRFVSPVKDFRDLSKLNLQFPILTKKLVGENAFGDKITSCVEGIPEITAINDNLERIHGGWKVGGIAGKKSIVDIVFLLAGVSTKRLPRNNPTLIINIDPRQDPFSTSLIWIGHQSWMKVLEDRARNKLRVMLADDLKRKRGLDKFAGKFRMAKDIQKLEILANKLGFSCPRSVGKAIPAWNTTWHVWKALVWVYRLGRLRGDMINVQNLAEDEWLEKMLGWPTTHDAVVTRSKNIWFWFKDLESLGFVVHSNKQWFKVTKNLPKDFVPWSYISNRRVCK